ncbi:hypothetical protein MJO29_005196 [Puccinia striiformis f. sp. tritici]|nr:hypothetical protein MJO29_005196 [Puccinia striiformis f. sp. tritici]
MVNVVKTTFLQHSQQKPKLAIDKTQLSAIQTTYTLKQVSQCHPDPRQIGPTEPVFDVVQHLMSLLTVLRQPLQPEQTKKPTFEVDNLPPTEPMDHQNESPTNPNFSNLEFDEPATEPHRQREVGPTLLAGLQSVLDYY